MKWLTSTIFRVPASQAESTFIVVKQINLTRNHETHRSNK